MRFVRTILLSLLLSPALPVLAQDYPSRPITLVVPFSAGGPGDVIGRLLGTSMSATLKQPIVIENVVGAGGTLGTNRVAKAPPDGHTILLMHVGQSTAPALYAKLPFDPVGDFAPIGLVTDVPMILVARPNFPAKDLKELVAHVHAQGDKVTYGNVGLGSASHLCGLMFMSAIGTQAHPDLLQGRRTGPERHHRRSHRRLLRSGHRTDALYPGQHHSGLRDHQQEARTDPAEPAHLGGSRRAGVRRHHLVRTVCAARHPETDRG